MKLQFLKITQTPGKSSSQAHLRRQNVVEQIARLFLVANHVRVLVKSKDARLYVGGKLFDVSHKLLVLVGDWNREVFILIESVFGVGENFGLVEAR